MKDQYIVRYEYIDRRNTCYNHYVEAYIDCDYFDGWVKSECEKVLKFKIIFKGKVSDLPEGYEPWDNLEDLT